MDSLGNGDALHAGVNDKEGAGQPCHLFDAAEVAVEALNLLIDLQGFFLGEALELAAGARVLQSHQVVDATLDGGEVGESATQPAVVDIGHRAALGLQLDGLLGLFLGAHKENGLSPGHHVPDEVTGFAHALHGLLKVDDVNAVALREDEAAHSGVPTPGLMPEVDPRFQERFHRCRCYQLHSSCVSNRKRPREGPLPGDGRDRRKSGLAPEAVPLALRQYSTGQPREGNGRAPEGSPLPPRPHPAYRSPGAAASPPLAPPRAGPGCPAPPAGSGG
jgi:hypothetical protein